MSGSSNSAEAAGASQKSSADGFTLHIQLFIIGDKNPIVKVCHRTIETGHTSWKLLRDTVYAPKSLFSALASVLPICW